jgi:hypothetical protein
MNRGRGGQHVRRWLAPAVAALVAASIGFASPALARQTDGDSGRSEFGRAHSAQGHGYARGHTHPRPASSDHSAAGEHGGSGVNLPRPNDFQAQADPDGAANGGVDQPGGSGGVDPTAQDGNNGSGNDADCEDDNRGVGVPGHCTPQPEPVVTPPGDDVIPPPSDTDVGVPVAVPVVPDTGEPVVSPPAASSTAVTQARAVDGATVLPNTGAGPALFGLALAAVTALLVGAGLARQGRRLPRVTE